MRGRPSRARLPPDDGVLAVVIPRTEEQGSGRPGARGLRPDAPRARGSSLRARSPRRPRGQRRGDDEPRRRSRPGLRSTRPSAGEWAEADGVLIRRIPRRGPDRPGRSESCESANATEAGAPPGDPGVLAGGALRAADRVLYREPGIAHGPTASRRCWPLSSRLGGLDAVPSARATREADRGHGPPEVARAHEPTPTPRGAWRSWSGARRRGDLAALERGDRGILLGALAIAAVGVLDDIGDSARRCRS